MSAVQSTLQVSDKSGYAFRCFDDRIRPPNHVVQVGAGRHHRVHGVFLLDAEVEQHGAP